MFIIENVLLDLDCEKLTLIAADGNELRFELEGECCSHSYFDDDSKVDARGLLGDTLLSVQYNYIDCEQSEYGHVKQYALILKTNRQSITLMWRNSSNGYYDGTVVPFVNDVEARYDADEAMAPLGVKYSYGGF